MKNTIKLPHTQKDIIVKALKTYQTALRTLTPMTDDQHYTDFDITTLTVVSDIEKSNIDSINGVDFPQYV